MTTYEPGTVAVATVRGVKGVRVFRTGSPQFGKWIAAESEGYLSLWVDAQQITDIRPLVVLDPTCEAVREFLEAHAKGGEPKLCSSQPVADLITAQVKPPRIPEPGLWGVVEGSVNVGGYPWQWVHHPNDVWLNSEGDSVRWRDLINPVLIREGAES